MTVPQYRSTVIYINPKSEHHEKRVVLAYVDIRDGLYDIELSDGTSLEQIPKTNLHGRMSPINSSLPYEE